MTGPASSRFAYQTPDAAVAAVCARLAPVGRGSVCLSGAVGRVLAEDLQADRDSPPCDVSAMDGYAVSAADLEQTSLPVSAEARMGVQPPAVPKGAAVRIVTGAPVPAGADLVIRREDTDESDRQLIRWRTNPRQFTPGQNIRRQGQNLRAGETALQAGALITPATVALLASIGVARVQVRRPLRLAILSTGDELDPVESSPTPWRIRDSNGPALQALFSRAAWIDLLPAQHAVDSPGALRAAMCEALASSDALLMTGGVSMGDYDLVPRIAAELGASPVFHKLPVRPGKPIFVAIASTGQPIIGLPGNPVSALVGAVRLVGPILRHLGGVASGSLPGAEVTLASPDSATLGLWWWRLVRFTAPGAVTLVPSQGSGDLVSAARSDGFIELPPLGWGAGPWPVYRWEI